jgi:UDP-glucose 4-epimerase
MGSAGFIGSSLVDALLARGDSMTVVDEVWTGKTDLEQALAAGATLEVADVSDAQAATEIIATSSPRSSSI